MEDFKRRPPFGTTGEQPSVPRAPILVTLAGTLAESGTASATVTNGNGEEANGATVTVTEILGTNGDTIASGKKCKAEWFNGVGWCVTAAGC